MGLPSSLCKWSGLSFLGNELRVSCLPSCRLEGLLETTCPNPALSQWWVPSLMLKGEILESLFFLCLVWNLGSIIVAFSLSPQENGEQQDFTVLETQMCEGLLP